MNFSPLARALAATTIVYTVLGAAKSARAHEAVWRPRRHHRRMGERIADDWAQQAVDVRKAACMALLSHAERSIDRRKKSFSWRERGLKKRGLRS